jgi:hypothetical protein
MGTRIDKARDWLQSNKIFFEVSSAFCIGLASFFVSLFSWLTSDAQLKVAQAQLKVAQAQLTVAQAAIAPSIHTIRELEFDPVKKVYTSEVLEVLLHLGDRAESIFISFHSVSPNSSQPLPTLGSYFLRFSYRDLLNKRQARKQVV